MDENSLQSIYTFQSSWSLKLGANQKFARSFETRAKVAVFGDAETKNDETFVLISTGPGDLWRIEIAPTECLRDRKMAFVHSSSETTSVLFDEDYDTLVLEGDAPEMGGEFSLRIHPLVDV
jgi:hypothetical protein